MQRDYTNRLFSNSFIEGISDAFLNDLRGLGLFVSYLYFNKIVCALELLFAFCRRMRVI